MASSKRILVVEDEADLAELLIYNLRKRGYDTEHAADGIAAVSAATHSAPDLILLDVMLPKLSGLDVAKKLRTDPRTSNTPIIMLTARSEETDQIVGLDAGADDYVTKPFSTKVLLARIEAILRRSATTINTDEFVRTQNLEADLTTHEVFVDKKPVKLTLTEFRILVALMRSRGKVLSRSDLMYAAMGPSVMVTARTIDVHIAAIRKKLGPTAPNIKTIRGVGYLLEDTQLVDAN